MTDAITRQDACPTHAAKLYLQGAGPWKLDEIGIAEDDYLVQCFSRYRAAIIEECAALIEQAAPSIYDMGETYVNKAAIAKAIRALAD